MARSVGPRIFLISVGVFLALSGYARAEFCDIHLRALGVEYAKPGELLELKGSWGDAQEKKVVEMTSRKNRSRLKVVSWTPDVVTVRLPEYLPPGQYGVGISCPADEQGVVRTSGWLKFRVKDDRPLERILVRFDHPIGWLWLWFMGIVLFLVAWSVLFPSAHPGENPPDGRETAIQFLSSAGTLNRALDYLEKKKKYARRNHLTLGWFLTASSATVLLYLGASLVAGHVSASWPWTEDSQVLSSDVEFTAFGARNNPYAPVVQYEYRVEGRRYKADRVFFGISSKGRGHAQRFVADNPPGGPVRVHYFSRFPALSVLIPGVRKTEVGFFVFAGLLFVIGAFILRKTPPPYEPDRH